MKTQEELRREYDRLFEAEDYEAAGKVLDLIEPISDEAFRRILDEAPLDDEPIPQFIQDRYAELEVILARRNGQRAG